MMTGIFKLNVANAIPLPSIFETVIVDGVETQVEIKQYDWIPALKAAALELVELNKYSGTEAFPFPISCNPDAMALVEETTDNDGNIIPAHWEGAITGFLGDFNSPPTADRGMVTVNINAYEWLETDLFPAMPTQFFITVGNAPAGKILE